MSSAIAAALPYAFAAMLAAPAVLAVSALILSVSKQPQLSTWVFVAGALVLDAIFAAGLYAVMQSTGADSSSDFAAILDIVLGAVFIVMGLLALSSHESPESRAANRARLERIASGRLITLLLAGVLVQVINFDALLVFAGGIKEIAQEKVALGTAVVAIGVSILIMLVPYYSPALVYAASPGRSQRRLTPMSAWVLDHTRRIEILLGFGFGCVFLLKGIRGL